jgi:hypothetical protein
MTSFLARIKANKFLAVALVLFFVVVVVVSLF